MKNLLKPTSWLVLLQSAIIISWQPNSESDLKGYKVYYGMRSRMYDQVESVGADTSYTIDNLKGGNKYFIAVTAFDYIGNESSYSNEVVVSIDSDQAESENYNIQNSYNYPNPFNPLNEATHIRYSLESSQHITLKIFNEQGLIVADLLESQFREAGEHTEDIWNGHDKSGDVVQNGVYYCHIQTDGAVHNFPIVVIK